MIIMNKTYTPELAPEVLHRLRDYAEPFQDLFRYPSQFAWSGVYLRGLLKDGERKSIEPMASRVPRPPQLLDVKDPEQALQQFVNQSPWDHQQVENRYRRVLARALASPQGIFVLDDTGFPKQGKHSVGVQHQYCGQLGKKANCQVAVTVHYVSPAGHFPAALRLFLPKSWTDSPERMERAGVPAEYRHEQTKGQIALELLDQVRGEGLLPGDVVITDAGYGVSQEFRQGLEQHGLFYIAGVSPEMVVFTEEPRAGTGPRGDRPGPDRAAAPPGQGQSATREPEVAGREPAAPQGDLARGDQGEVGGEVRLGPRLAGPGLGPRCLCRCPADLAVDRGAGRQHDPVCLLELAGEHPSDPGGPALEEPLAGGAGLPADEGRAGPEPFRGSVVAQVPSPRLPGDAGLWFPGLGTVAHKEAPAQPGEKRDEPPRITVPGIRRALQRLLSPRAKPDCNYCNPFHHLLFHRSEILTE